MVAPSIKLAEAVIEQMDARIRAESTIKYYEQWFARRQQWHRDAVERWHGYGADAEQLDR